MATVFLIVEITGKSPDALLTANESDGDKDEHSLN